MANADGEVIAHETRVESKAQSKRFTVINFFSIFNFIIILISEF